METSVGDERLAGTRMREDERVPRPEECTHGAFMGRNKSEAPSMIVEAGSS